MVDGIRLTAKITATSTIMLTKVSKEVSELLLMVVVVVLASIPCPNLVLK